VSRLVAFHRDRKPIVTVTAVRPPARFGELAIENSRVYEFNEKTQTAGGMINGGFFVCDARRIWSYLSGRTDDILEVDALRRMAADGELLAYCHQGFWQPMDTPREHALLNELWASGRAPWQQW
jgi:glucose-1-phosphate cytidylyltransferase